MRRSVGLGLLLTAGFASAAVGQGYRLRVDSRFQAVSYRGVELDSVPVSSVVRNPGQGPVSADGFAVDCDDGTPGFCYFYRPGPRRDGRPLTANADLTLWGLGVPGLTIRASGRLATELADGPGWPGTEPGLILTEGYLEYAGRALSGRLGRQLATGRLGWQGFDGARAGYRAARLGLEVAGYLGRGLARAVALPVTSPVLDPLDDFQPRDRQLVVGAEVGWRQRWFDLRTEYRREIDPAVDYFVSERASLSIEGSPLARLRLAGGAEYDFANGWWGTSEIGATWTAARWYATGQLRRYRPFFDLWTIWGAFSPVPYRSVAASVAAQPASGLWVRLHGERYWFEADDAETPLVAAEDRGWRAQLAASAAVTGTLTVDGALRAEYGPGASSRTIEAGFTWHPARTTSLGLRGGTLDRPLEFRYSDASVEWLAATGEVQLSSRWRVVTDLGWFGERRNRPDAAAFDLDQLRIGTRLVATFGSSADRLPRAIPRAARPAGASGGTP